MTRFAAAVLLLVPFVGSISAQQAKPPDSNSPTAIYDRLADLKMGEVAPLSKAERAAWDRWYALRTKADKTAKPATDDELLEAAISCSGTTEEQRANYRRAFADLMTGAKKATAKAADDLERGEALMKFLHEGVMAKGYDLEQSTLTAVFDTGKFNCVSSSVLYYLVGKRLGLTLEGISIPGNGSQPGHACIDLLHEKDRIDVEPTCPNGFHWSEKLKRPGVIAVGFQPDRNKGKRVDGPALIALIASNRSIDAAKSKPPQPLEALRAQLLVLTLDPKNDEVRTHLAGIFVNWGPRLMNDDRFEDALRVLHFGRTIAPGDDALNNNLNVTYVTFIHKQLTAGKDAEVAALLTRAAAAFPNDKHFNDPLFWYEIEAQARSKESWEAGASLYDRALKTFPEKAAAVRDARASHIRRWSQKLLADDDADGSLKVLIQADKQQPDDAEIRKGIEFHIQSAFRILGVDRRKMLGHYTAMKVAFPKNAWLDEQGDRYARKRLADLADAKKFAEALTMTDHFKVFLGADKNSDGLKADVYIRWSRHLADAVHPQAGLDKCSEGLRLLKGRADIADAQLRIIDRWAEKLMKDKEWGEAMCIYGYGLGYFPNQDRFVNNMAYCLQEANRK